MTYTFREVRRENVPLLLGVAGGTGSGKTLSALLIARGIAAGQPFAFIDTENGRAKIYANRFPEMRWTPITAPFRPERYAEAIADAEKFLEQQNVPLEYRVVVVDSASHEWAGDGGCLDWQEEIMGGNQNKSPVAWAQVKKSHKRMVTRLLQVRAHVLLCFRAEPKIDIVRENGETKFVPKASLTGLDGWLPITEKMMPYELTASFLLMADARGVPRPIKLPDELQPLVPLDQPLSEETGRKLAEWARGSAALPEGERSEGVPLADGGSPSENAAFDGPPSDDPIVIAANEAREVLIPAGTNKGKPLRDLLKAGPDGEKWMRYALRNWSDDTFGKACWAFSRVYMPDVYDKILTEKEAAVA